MILFIGLTAISNIVSNKIVDFMGKIKLRYYIITIIVILLVAIIVIGVGIQMKTPLVIFNDINQRTVPTQDINNIMPNTKYKFEFDINAKVEYTKENIYEIEICERNKYDDIIKTHKIEFGNFKGRKELEFETTSYTYKILLKFNTKRRLAQRGLTINWMKINDKEVAVNYKYLPIRLVDKIKDIKLNTISVRGRFTYIEDTLKLISKYGILGIGADGWKDRMVEVQEYYDYAYEPHSYILEVFCEFGILGFVSLVFIFIYLLKRIVLELRKKDKNLTKISIILGAIVLFIHSAIDFNLSFVYMLVIFFTLLAIAHDEEKDYKIVDMFSKVLVVILLIIAIYFDTRVCISKYIKNEENPYSQEYIYKRLEAGEEFSKNIDEMVKRRKYTSHVNEFKKLIYSDKLNEDEYYELFEILKSEEYLLKNDVFMKYQEIQLYKELLEKFDKNIEKYNECKNTIVSEIESTRKLLENPEKCRLSFEEIEEYKINLNEIENEVKF